ncbi:hypothetical protein N9901_02485 [Flavobacteriaceae bacterium]|nr:hypothetical protein [Flavobacteriaceae bacterium]
MLRRILLKVVKHCPVNSITLFVYRSYFGYTIGSNVKIGKSVINCKRVSIADNVIIRNNNNISCGELQIGKGTTIHSDNKIIGSGFFRIGKDSRIINDHFFDVWNGIEIGDRTWFAGRSSQVWSHGSLKTKLGKDLAVYIGDDNYISSNCSIAPGVVIGNVNLIGLGSVVHKSFVDCNKVIAGNSAVVLKENVDWRDNW